jgi:hypothetical protein
MARRVVGRRAVAEAAARGEVRRVRLHHPPQAGRAHGAVDLARMAERPPLVESDKGSRMATRTATIVNASFLDASNWDTPPVNSDTAAVVGGSTDIDGAATGLTGIDLRWGSGYTGTVADSTTWLDIDTSSFSFDSGGPAAYFTGTHTDIIVQGGANNANMLNFQGNASTAITTMRVVGGLGTITVGSNASLGTLEVAGADSITIDIKASVSGIADIDIDGGILDLASSWTGTLRVRSGAVVTVTGTADGAWEVEDGGLLIWNSSGAWVGSTSVVWPGGTFDGSGNATAAIAAFGTTEIHNAGRMLLDTPIRTFVNLSVLNHGGGVVRPHPGATVSFA